MPDHVTDAALPGEDHLALLDLVLEAAGGAADVAEGLGRILDLTLARLGLDAGAVILFDDDGVSRRIVCARGLAAGSAGTRAGFAATQTGFATDGHPFAAVLGGEAVFLGRDARDGVPAGFESSGATPLSAGDEVLGALVVLSRSRREWHSAQRTVLRSVGRVAGELVRRLRAGAVVGERRHTTELSALLEANRAIAASIDYDEVLRRIAKAAGEALESRECIIWEYSPEGDLALFRCLWERDPAPGVAANLDGASYEIRTHSGGLDALRAGVVVQESLSDPELPPGSRGDMEKWGEKTWLTVPLVFNGRLLGVMILIETERERTFTPEEVRMAGDIGAQAAVALANALRHRREEEQNRWLRSLIAASRSVAEARDPDAALGHVARLAAEAMQSPAAFIYEYLHERDELVTRARHATPTTGRDDAVGQAFPVANTPEDRRALDSGEIFAETLSDQQLPAEVRRAMEAFGERTLLNVPLRFRGEALGLLVLVEDEAERTFTPEEHEFMHAFGEQVTLAMTTARLATTDGLTGLVNHRVFYERLGQEIARARRYGSPVSLLMLDIDDFKALNDTYGHPAGDEILRRLGRLIGDGLRRNVDVAARYGGEEFAVILPGTAVAAGSEPGDAGSAAPPGDNTPAPGHCEGAEALAERLRALIAGASLEVDTAKDPVRITVSIGVACYPDMAGNMDDLVARADAALYAAKRAGKNRAEVYWRREERREGATHENRSGRADTP